MLSVSLAACGCVTSQGEASAQANSESTASPLTVHAAQPLPPGAVAAEAQGAMNDQRPDEKPNQKQLNDKGRVALGWQKKMLATLHDSGYSDAWGLFSSGGWSDNGQIMLLGSPAMGPASAMRVLTVGPNLPDGSPVEKALTTGDFSSQYAGVLAAGDHLDDFSLTAFDALSYEYVHAVKDGKGDIKVVSRVYIRNPIPKKVPMPQHESLIKAMQSLR